MIAWWGWALLVAVGLQRLVEMAVARRHVRRLLARGGRLVPEDGYPRIVAVHVAFFLAFAVEAWRAPWSGTGIWTPVLLAVFVIGQALRLWTMRTLGERWTTRVVVLPGREPVAKGPFRFLRHPNYLGVSLELFALPLAFGLPITAGAITGANALALRHRIRREEGALEEAAAEPRTAGTDTAS